MYSTMILTHGLIYTGGFALIILVSVLINPRIWMQDFPEDVKNDIPPKNNRELQQTFITGFIFALFIVGFPIFSLSVYIKDFQIDDSFTTLFLYSFSVMMICNILYWVIFDILIFNLVISHIRTVPGLKKKLKFSGWKRQAFGLLVGILTCGLISSFAVITARFFN